MVNRVTFRFVPSFLGSFDQPQPPIPHLSGVILLQRGEALVGVWDEECGGFLHPTNQRDLAKDALEAILADFPNVDLGASELCVFTCPESIVAKFNFACDPRSATS